MAAAGSLVLTKFGNILSALRGSSPPPAATHSNFIIPASLFFLSRSVHVSVYDRNPEEQLVQPSIVPDYVIPPYSDNYWTPDPHTGVFGPAKDHIPALGSDRGIATEDSVLEQKTFFRPLEHLDKPIQ